MRVQRQCSLRLRQRSPCLAPPNQLECPRQVESHQGFLPPAYTVYAPAAATTTIGPRCFSIVTGPPLSPPPYSFVRLILKCLDQGCPLAVDVPTPTPLPCVL